MALPESSLSIICASIAQFVRNGVNAAANNISVSIGAPGEIPEGDEQHKLNLFFYRFEPGGFDSDVHPNDPWRIRLFCMISAFGVDDDGVPAGENDLRILGEVLRIFRETPVLGTVGVNGEQVRLQVVFSPATDEQINQIWSTQGDTTYRPSVIYEMALAPVMPSQLRVEPPLVGAFGHQAREFSAGRFATFSGVIRPPKVPSSIVDIENPQWAPALCWVHQEECAHTLSFDVDSPGFAGFTPSAPVAATPFGTGIDPEHIPAGEAGVFPLEVDSPVSIPAGGNAAQGLLYARRTVTTVPGGPSVIVRSNPLLLSLYRTV